METQTRKEAYTKLLFNFLSNTQTLSDSQQIYDNPHEELIETTKPTKEKEKEKIDQIFDKNALQPNDRNSDKIPSTSIIIDTKTACSIFQAKESLQGPLSVPGEKLIFQHRNFSPSTTNLSTCNKNINPCYTKRELRENGFIRKDGQSPSNGNYTISFGAQRREVYHRYASSSCSGKPRKSHDDGIMKEYDLQQFSPALDSIKETDEAQTQAEGLIELSEYNESPYESQSSSLSMERLSTNPLAKDSSRQSFVYDFPNSPHCREDSFIDGVCEPKGTLETGNDYVTPAARYVTTSLHENITPRRRNLSSADTVDSSGNLPPYSNYTNSLNSRSSHSSYAVDSAYSSRERLNTLYSSIPHIFDEGYEEDFVEYIPVSYAEARMKKKKGWLVRSASDVHRPPHHTGDLAIDKFHNARKRFTRTLSKKGKKSANHEKPKNGAKVTYSPSRKPNVGMSISRKSSFRKVFSRFLRHVRGRDFKSKNKPLRERSQSLPANLDES